MSYILFLCINLGGQGATCVTASYPDYNQCAYGAKTFEPIMFKKSWVRPTINWYCQSVRIK